ncbi:MAG TPA: hypothetical protein VD998_03595 [Verrucomicrobiae bacterium]|nr:hypothetical protein [Verrucomicrobiae bacterium]
MTIDDKIRDRIRRGRGDRSIASELKVDRTKVVSIREDMERQKKSRRIGIIGVSIAMLVALAAIVISVQSTRPEDPKILYARAADVFQPVFIRSGPERWLLTGHESFDPEGMQRQLELIQTLQTRLERSLNDNASIPAVAKLGEQFSGKMVASLFNLKVGGPVTLTRDPNQRPAPGFVSTVFYGQAARNHPVTMGQILHFKSEWGALIIAGMDYDSRWFQALGLHELFHALMAREGQASATAQKHSDSWIEEELNAHGIERDVLDLQTQGQYKRRLLKLTETRASSALQFLASLNPDDVLELDKLFLPSTGQEANLRSAQYMIDLGTTWISRNLPSEEIDSAEAEFYRLIATR